MKKVVVAVNTENQEIVDWVEEGVQPVIENAVDFANELSDDDLSKLGNTPLMAAVKKIKRMASASITKPEMRMKLGDYNIPKRIVKEVWDDERTMGDMLELLENNKEEFLDVYGDDLKPKEKMAIMGSASMVTAAKEWPAKKGDRIVVFFPKEKLFKTGAVTVKTNKGTFKLKMDDGTKAEIKQSSKHIKGFAKKKQFKKGSPKAANMLDAKRSEMANEALRLKLNEKRMLQALKKKAMSPEGLKKPQITALDALVNAGLAKKTKKAYVISPKGKKSVEYLPKMVKGPTAKQRAAQPETKELSKKAKGALEYLIEEGGIPLKGKDARQAKNIMTRLVKMGYAKIAKKDGMQMWVATPAGKKKVGDSVAPAKDDEPLDLMPDDFNAMEDIVFKRSVKATPKLKKAYQYLMSKGFVKQKGKNLVPTEKGLEFADLHDMVPDPDSTDIESTIGKLSIKKNGQITVNKQDLTAVLKKFKGKNVKITITEM